MANLPRDQTMQKPTASQNAPRVLSAITCSAAGGIADPDEPVSFSQDSGLLKHACRRASRSASFDTFVEDRAHRVEPALPY